MAELEPIWTKANDFLISRGVSTERALEAMKRLGWSVDLIGDGLGAGERIIQIEDVKISEIGGLNLEEQDREGRLTRNLILSAEDEAVTATLQFIGEDEIYKTFLSEADEGNLRYQYPLTHKLKSISVSAEGDICLSGDDQGKLGLSSSQLLLMSNGGFMVSQNFALTYVPT